LIDMPAAAWWPYSASSVPVIDVGFVAALKRGQIHVRTAIKQLSETGAIFADGRAEPFDAVIAATGFRTGLDQLIDLPGALDSRGEPAFPSGKAYRVSRPVLRGLHPQPARTPV
jgi:putative flavoprotein involved in K+ transport